HTHTHTHTHRGATHTHTRDTHTHATQNNTHSIHKHTGHTHGTQMHTHTQHTGVKPCSSPRVPLSDGNSATATRLHQDWRRDQPALAPLKPCSPPSAVQCGCFTPHQ